MAEDKERGEDEYGEQAESSYEVPFGQTTPPDSPNPRITMAKLPLYRSGPSSLGGRLTERGRACVPGEAEMFRKASFEQFSGLDAQHDICGEGRLVFQ
jgi:hypothetical protein